MFPAEEPFKRQLEDDSAASDCKRAKRSPSEGEQGKEDQQTVITQKKRRTNINYKEGKRDRRGTRGTRAESSAEGGTESGEKKVRLPKRNCAILLGFCGTGYNGMQIQPDVKTIENVLFQALVKAGAVSQDNADDPVKVGLARAARTDAGVHAAGNVISIKLITEVPGVPNMTACIQEGLPPEIRLWSILRAQNSFNAHTACDSRMYTYFLPTYVLIPPKPGSGFAESLKLAAEAAGMPLKNHSHPFWENMDISESFQNDLPRKRNWRIDADTLTKFRLTTARYLGTHNFHNFTVSREFNDRSNNRHMKKIDVHDPVVYGDTEWIAILFHGQSFMLHQRKMICALVLTCRTNTPSNVIHEMYGPSKITLPKAPALGLLLEQPVFDSYNRKATAVSASTDPSNSAYRPAIHFEPYRAEIEQFKEEQIYSRMRSQEDNEAIYDSWIRSIDSYSGRDFWYLNPEGKILPEAVVEKGRRRQNPFRERKRFDAVGPTCVEQAGDESDEEVLDIAKLKDMEG